jgi:predicted transcriptional regulator
MSVNEQREAPVSIRMPDDLVEELRAVAKENDRSLSYQARLALREWLEAYAKAKAA